MSSVAASSVSTSTSAASPGDEKLADLKSIPHLLETIQNNTINSRRNSRLSLDNASFFGTIPTTLISSPVTPVTTIAHPRKPSEAGLHLRTDWLEKAKALANPSVPAIAHPINEVSSSAHALHPSRSWESFTSIQSAGSSINSPASAALGDITPLPSPFTLGNSPELWRKAVGRPHSSSGASVTHEDGAGYLSPSMLSTSPQRRRKAYPGLGVSTPSAVLQKHEDLETHRTVSEFVPDPLHNTRWRTVTQPNVPLAKVDEDDCGPKERPMKREEYLAKSRGLIEQSEIDPSDAVRRPSLGYQSLNKEQEHDAQAGQEERHGLLRVRNAMTKKTTFWTPVRELGQGAFSKVMLAKRTTPKATQELVAIKVMSHIPTAGNDEERMETSIKREIEMLQSISHPCLIRLEAFEEDERQALLVMNYCPGGDLFELTSQRRDVLTPPVIQRIFAELAGAISYLHERLIVHRDIKLENVLVNIDPSHIANLPHPLSTYPHPLITLTDLGLSKRIPPPPSIPLLTHACGSADYAAPELLLGQPYDGRLTDAWALGVLLYALMEGRLPFDPLPVSDSMTPAEQRRRRRGHQVGVKHRIARCDWMWCEFGDEDGNWVCGPEMEGAKEVVEGLLRKVGRGRWGVEKVCGALWVKQGVLVEGGLRVDVG